MSSQLDPTDNAINQIRSVNVSSCHVSASMYRPEGILVISSGLFLAVLCVCSWNRSTTKRKMRPLQADGSLTTDNHAPMQSALVEIEATVSAESSAEINSLLARCRV